jgi:putative FmdB family regulatory protein
MPIYEFKCLKCNEFFEILVMKSEDAVEMHCTKCGSEDFERILSASHSVMGDTGADQGVKTESRTCSGGSCTTLEIPGPSR